MASAVATRIQYSNLFPRLRVVVESSNFFRRLSQPTFRSCSTNAASEDGDNSAKSEQLQAAEAKFLEEKAKLDEDLKELKDKYQRALAESENIRQRMSKQIADAKIFGVQSFCKDLLEVADVLDTATTSVPKEILSASDCNPHLKGLYDGLVMTGDQLQKAFGRHGLQKISPDIGAKFDPNFHEALFEAPLEGNKDAQPGGVAVVTKIGYKLHDRTLRPALVGVFKSD